LLNKAAIVEQYYRFIHADASAGNEGILEVMTTPETDINSAATSTPPQTKRE
jgi:hypothetical protein